MAFHNETMLTNTGIYFKIIKSFTATAGIFGRYRVPVSIFLQVSNLKKMYHGLYLAFHPWI